MNIKIGKILADGLLVSFLTYFNGTIDLFHMSTVSFVFFTYHHSHLTRPVHFLQISSAEDQRHVLELVVFTLGR